MGWLGDMIDRDNKIVDDLLSYVPEDRETVLNLRYGLVKEDFPFVDFGEDKVSNNRYSVSTKPDISDTFMMSNRQMWELGNAGIDPDMFDLMDNDEKIEALEDAGLDPEDFE